MGFFRWSLAFIVGVALFAVLPEYGSLVVLQAGDEDNFFLGVGGSSVIGATLVFVVGRPLALVLCFVCPLAGVALYQLLAFGKSGFAYLEVTFYTIVYFAFAMLGGGVVVLVLAVVRRLQRQG